MGWGDELMAAGEARKVREETGQRVQICARLYHRQHCEVWKYCPDVDQKSAQKIYKGSGYRPYIGQGGSNGYGWKKYKPIPARIELAPEHKQWAEQFGQGFIIIEPNVKPEPIAKLNKDWGVVKYQELVRAMQQYQWVQPTYGGQHRLKQVTKIETPSYIHMLALMERAAGYVGPEGGLHHAAAAFNKPAVVIFGGYISPQVTGYDFHHNIFTGKGLGCGSRTVCQCDCMKSISVEQVIEAVNKTIPLAQEAPRP